MIVVYTAIFGDLRRDRLQPPPAGCDARYVCFTDGAPVPNGWGTEHVSSVGRSPIFLARLFKMRPDRWFGPDDTTIWIDASCELLMAAAQLVAAAGTAAVAALRHPDRATVEAEAEAVIRGALAPAEMVRGQLAHYAAQGFHARTAGVTTTGVLVRTPAAAAFNQLWEEQIIRWTLRDQLSVDYCAWRTGTAIAHLAGHYRSNPYMRYTRHPRLAS